MLIVPKHAIEFYDEHDVKIAKVMFSDEVHLEVGEDRFTLIDYDEHNLKKLVNSWYGEDVLVQS